MRINQLCTKNSTFHLVNRKRNTLFFLSIFAQTYIYTNDFDYKAPVDGIGSPKCFKSHRIRKLTVFYFNCGLIRDGKKSSVKWGFELWRAVIFLANLLCLHSYAIQMSWYFWVLGNFENLAVSSDYNIPTERAQIGCLFLCYNFCFIPQHAKFECYGIETCSASTSNIC